MFMEQLTEELSNRPREEGFSDTRFVRYENFALVAIFQMTVHYSLNSHYKREVENKAKKYIQN